MKKVIAIIIGLAIILIALMVTCFSSSFTFTFSNQAVLKSPKVDVAKSTVNTNEANYINNEKLKNITSNNTNSNYSNIVNNTDAQSTGSQDEATTTALNHLVSSDGVLYGYVADGANIIIPCSQGTIVNGELSVPEYYVSMPWEKFDDYISIQNGKYIIKEYYQGKQTGVFNLSLGNKGLNGTFTHIANNQTYNANFDFENNFKSGSLSKKPFYIGVIGNTAVTLTNEFNGSYSEYYHGDKHLLAVKKQNGSQNANYNIQLNEYNGDSLTGKYFLNNVGNDTYTGIFIENPNGASPIKSTVGLTGSFSPFSV